MACWPVVSCVNTEKFAAKRSFACETGTWRLSQSPAGEIALAVRLWFASHWLMAATVWFEGATNAAAYIVDGSEQP